MKKALLLCCILLSITWAYSQDTLTPKKVPGKVIDGDTVATLEMSSIMIFPPGQYLDRTELQKMQRLIYNVRKVYPYAKLAATKLGEYQKVLDTIQTERKKKQFIRKAQKELEAQFEADLKKLSFNQGKILIKLIYRQTGNSTFEIVKELRGGFNAFVWQSMARLFGLDLKTGYDPEGEDQSIEKIVLMIDSGAL
jgi:hypothetical protein